MCDYTKVTYQCGHVRYLVKAWYDRPYGHFLSSGCKADTAVSRHQVCSLSADPPEMSSQRGSDVSSDFMALMVS